MPSARHSSQRRLLVLIIDRKHRIRERPTIDDPVSVRLYAEAFRGIGLLLVRRVVQEALRLVPESGLGIEIATGPGLSLRLLAEKVPSVRWVGFDISVEMVRAARKEIGKLHKGRRKVWVVAADANQLPLRESSADFVFCSYSLHHLDEVETLLDEVARVVSCSGGLLIVDLVRDASLPAILALELVWRFLLKGRQVPGISLLESFKSAFTAREYIAAVARSKLRDVWASRTIAEFWISRRSSRVSNPHLIDRFGALGAESERNGR